MMRNLVDWDTLFIIVKYFDAGSHLQCLYTIVEGISQPWHSLAPSLGAESQGSWISWQQVYSRVDSRSMEV